ncbi:hypothetical protein CyaNS01_01456 [Cyanobium sp. NS01]|nr:hypothetical protein CyaNS01_01456 [Cyanobium sp. NS01]
MTGHPKQNLARSPRSRQHRSMASSPSAALLRLRQTTALRILASAWWAGFTFNGITA